MAIFWIMTLAMNDNGKNVGFPWLVFDGLEPADASAMDKLTKKFIADGIVWGERLDTDHGPNDTRIIRRRVPVALTPKGIASIIPVQNIFIEPPAHLGAAPVRQHSPVSPVPAGWEN